MTIPNDLSQFSTQASYAFTDFTNACDSVCAQVSETVSSICSLAANIFESFTSWAQENPGAFLGGLAAITAISYLGYELINAYNIYSANEETRSTLETNLSRAEREKNFMERVFTHARRNYLAAVGEKYIAQVASLSIGSQEQAHPAQRGNTTIERDLVRVDYWNTEEEINNRLTDLGELGDDQADPGQGINSTSIAHYKFKYFKAYEVLQQKTQAHEAAQRAFNNFTPQPIFSEFWGS